MESWLIRAVADEDAIGEPLTTTLVDLLRKLQQYGDEREVAHRSLVALATEYPRVGFLLFRFFEHIDLDHPHWVVVFPIGEVLAELAGSRAEIALPLLGHIAGRLEDPRRQAAALGIAKRMRQPTEAVVAVVLCQLRHESWLVRQAAIDALRHVDPPDVEVVRCLATCVGDRNWTVRLAARQALINILRAHPNLVPDLPVVFQTDLEQDLITWYGWEASSLDNSVLGLIRQPVPMGQKLLAAIYSDDVDLRDVTIRLLARWEVERDDGLTILALLDRWRERLFHVPSPAWAAAERLWSLLGNPALTDGALPEQSENNR